MKRKRISYKDREYWFWDDEYPTFIGNDGPKRVWYKVVLHWLKDVFWDSPGSSWYGALWLLALNVGLCVYFFIYSSGYGMLAVVFYWTVQVYRAWRKRRRKRAAAVLARMTGEGESYAR